MTSFEFRLLTLLNLSYTCEVQFVSEDCKTGKILYRPTAHPTEPYSLASNAQKARCTDRNYLAFPQFFQGMQITPSFSDIAH